MDIRVYAWAVVLMTLFFVCTKTLLISTLFTFLVLGLIPGTTVVIPAWVVLTIYPVLASIVIWWLSWHYTGRVTAASIVTPESVPARSQKAKRTRRVAPKAIAPVKRRVRSAT